MTKDISREIVKRKLQMLEENIKKQRYEQIIANFEDLISSPTDLTGGKDPSIFFYIFANKLKYLLENDPDLAISKEGVLIRRKINGIVKSVGKSFLRNPQVIENRKTLLNPDNSEEDNSIILPDKPVIWAPNHAFTDDILASVLATQRHSYLLLASLPQAYNTFDGITAWLNGAVVANRKVKSSKNSVIPKCVKAMKYGADITYFAEGVWCKEPDSLLLDFWPGIYRLAKETGAYIVPMVHYLRDCHIPGSTKKSSYKNEDTMSRYLRETSTYNFENVIHTVVDDPIRIDDLSERAGLEYLREVMGTWYYLMMESYGRSTRAEELRGFKTSERAWSYQLQQRVEGPLGPDRYDKEIELCADYRPKTDWPSDKKIVLPEEAFGPIAKLNMTAENESHVNYARQLVKTRQMENFQRRF